MKFVMLPRFLGPMRMRVILRFVVSAHGQTMPFFARQPSAGFCRYERGDTMPGVPA